MIYQLKIILDGATSAPKLAEELLGVQCSSDEAELRIGTKFSTLDSCHITGKFIEDKKSSGLLLLVVGEWHNDASGRQNLAKTAQKVFQICYDMMKEQHTLIFFNTQASWSKSELASEIENFTFDDLWAILGSSPISGDNTDFSLKTTGLKNLGFSDIELRHIPCGVHDFINSFIGGLTRWLIKEGFPNIGELNKAPKHGEVIKMDNHELRGTIKCRLVKSGNPKLYRIVSPIRGIGNINYQISTMVNTPKQKDINIIKNIAQNNISEMLKNFNSEDTKTVVRLELLYDEEKYEYIWGIVENIHTNSKILRVRSLDSPIHRVDISAEFPFDIKIEHVVDWVTIKHSDEISIIAGNYSGRFGG